MRSRAGRPVILAACDDPGDMRRIERELRSRYEADYRVVFEGFVLIGAEPQTGWLPAEIERGERGFIATGVDLTCKRGFPGGCPLERRPLPLETSMSGVFAASDARYRSVKRVASAVGEGSISIQQVHEYLGQIRPRMWR